MGSSTWTRRDFVAALAALPAVFNGDPYRPAVGSSPVGGAVRVRGRVMSLGRGLARVGVSDGLTVVRTDPDGRFDLVTDATRHYLSLSAPAGYQLPISATGTIKSFLPIAADRRGEMVAAFNLTPIPEGDERHAFLLLADIQTQDAADMDHFRRETLPDLSATLKVLVVKR